jgi:hypothetical protein
LVPYIQNIKSDAIKQLLKENKMSTTTITTNIKSTDNQFEGWGLRNLTPHPITLRCGDEDVIIPSSGRAEVHYGECHRIGGIVPTNERHRFGQPLPVIPLFGAEVPETITGIPDGDELLVVSSVVSAAMRQLNHPALARTFVLGTGPKDGTIRENGQVKAVTRLKQA